MLNVPKGKGGIGMSEILKLHHYHRWANEQVIQHLKTMPAASLQQELKSVFPTVNAVLVHICRADYIWLHVLYGETYEQIVSRFDQFEKLGGDLGAIEHRMTEQYEDYSRFLKVLENPEGPISISHPRVGDAEDDICRCDPACCESRHIPSRQHKRDASSNGI